jgi:hypothetical protein
MRLVTSVHQSHDPHPPTPPHKGEWSAPSARHCSASIRKEHRLVMSGPLERLFIERPYIARENSNRTSQIFLRQIG